MKKLAGRYFYVDYNNGVTALISQAVQNSQERARAIMQSVENAAEEMASRIAGVPGNTLTQGDRKFISDTVDAAARGLSRLNFPVFTFARAERVAESPWFTGDDAMFQRLKSYIEQRGGRVLRGGFYVPFSNGLEHAVHGVESLGSELRFVTSGQDFINEFGITPAELESYNFDN